MRHVLSTWTFGFGAMRQYGEPNAESMAVALLKHPDQLHMLRDDPALMDTAIDELLRFDSPVQLDGRMAVEDMEIGGKRIRPGQRVICLLGAANRDPSVFTNPDTLDITRQEKSHVSFGRGIHHCLGAPLALLEGQIAFAGLLERFQSIRLLREPEYRDQVVLRGVKELWIEVERSPLMEESLPRTPIRGLAPAHPRHSPGCFKPTELPPLGNLPAPL